MASSTQIAAVPIRRSGIGAIEVLLITSRKTRRWVVPKGWPWPGLSNSEAAASEAWEEAGVRGNVASNHIGKFHYRKHRGKAVLEVEVVVYLLEVTQEEHSWPEMDQRQRAWFSPADAAQAVAEPDLKALLRALEAS